VISNATIADGRIRPRAHDRHRLVAQTHQARQGRRRRAFGPLLIAHILLVVLSASATIALLASIDGDGPATEAAGAVPARTAGGIFVRWRY
jgi:hypothetical protein